MSQLTYTVDADDFCEDNSGIDLLLQIKEKNPAFRITLFTIPGRCTPAFLYRMKEYEWLELVPHGWLHQTNYECLNWTRAHTAEYLALIAHMGLVRGFKAPGWQIGSGVYQALLDAGYWVADQRYNDRRRPIGLKTYLLDPLSVHCHVGHLGGHNANALEYMADMLTEVKCQTVSERLAQ